MNPRKMILWYKQRNRQWWIRESRSLETGTEVHEDKSFFQLVTSGREKEAVRASGKFAPTGSCPQVWPHGHLTWIQNKGQ